MAPRTRSMTADEVQQRRRDAKAYLATAQLLVESDDATDWKTAGSNAVLGGIAAADAICGAVLGERSTSENHLEAKKLLDRATAPQSAPGAHVKKLIDEKSAFQYSSARVTQPRARKTITALERLVAHMESALAP